MIKKALVIDHKEARVYLIDDALLSIKSIKPSDEYEINHQHRHQKNSFYEGQNVPEDLDFYHKVAKSIADAQEILVLGHGKGRSSASLVFVKFLTHHYPTIMQHIVGLETVALMTDHAIVEHAQFVFKNEAHRKRLGLA